MIARWDFGLTLALAAGLHVAGFGYFATGVTDSGTGAEGVSVVTLAPSSEYVEALVAEWDQVPEAVDVVHETSQPNFQEASPSQAVAADPVVLTHSPSHPVAPEFAAAPERVTLDAPKLAQPESEVAHKTKMAALTAVSLPDSPKAVDWPVNEPKPFLSDIAPPKVPDFAVAEAPRPVERPVRRASAPALVARGTGSGVVAGQLGTSSGPKPVPAALAQAAQAEWAGKIQSRIARHQRYPRGARGEGRVRLRMTIGTDGRLGNVVVDRSSGSANFDRAALRAAEAAAPFPAAPNTLNKSAYVFAQWVSFAR